MNDSEAQRMTSETEDTPATSAMENNANDLHLKSDPAAFRPADSSGTANALPQDSDRLYPEDI